MVNSFSVGFNEVGGEIRTGDPNLGKDNFRKVPNAKFRLEMRTFLLW